MIIMDSINSRKFELPYNFDFELINKLSDKEGKYGNYNQYLNNVSCIYLPCYWKDGLNSRYNLLLDGTIPKNWEEYKKHLISLLNISKVAILIQQSCDIKAIDKYYSFGVKKFILTDNQLAKEIKWKYNDVELILSITKCATDEELINAQKSTNNLSEYSIYDKIVLPFRYCRQIQLLENLSKIEGFSKDKYILMVNSHCLYNCNRCKAHWILQSEDINKFREKEKSLTEGYCLGVYSEKRAYIQPYDLKYFDKYIGEYKLVDRLDSTEEILSNLEKYCNVNLYKDRSKNIDWYKLDE